MKIDNSKIYLATLNQAINCKGHDTDFDYATFDTKVLDKDQIVIQVAEEVFVPLVYIRNLLDMLTIKLAMKFGLSSKSDKFLSNRPNLETQDFCFLSDIRKLDMSVEKVPLEKLKKYQRVLDYNTNWVDNHYVEPSNIIDVEE